MELRKINRRGEILWVKETARVVEEQGQQQLFIVSEDISEKHELSKKLSYQASHDYLTDLLNRQEFERLLQQLLDTKSFSDDSEHTLCYLDLDQFKIINDACGHLAGDVLLKNISKILKLKIRQCDILARLGGDEFALLMEFCPLEKAMHIANDILQLIENYKFVWQGKAYSIGVSIGLVVIDSKADTLTKIMAFADEACYAAKEGGRNRVQIHRESDIDIHRRRLEMGWVTKIKEGIEKNKFKLFAQKIIPIDDNIGCHPSYELLVRLENQGETILPDVFLPSAERYNLATNIDQWVIEKAFDWLASLKHKQDKISYCTINLSGISLSDKQFLQFVLEQLDKYKVSGGNICFEITETAAISNFTGAIKFIDVLHKRGCRFALDDFGSGVSSFGYLKNLAVDFVKIDGSYIIDMDKNPVNLAMVKSINEIAHVMGKKTVAEYVESESILKCLKNIGVDYAQGHYIDKPYSINKNQLPINHSRCFKS